MMSITDKYILCKIKAFCIFSALLIKRGHDILLSQPMERFQARNYIIAE